MEGACTADSVWAGGAADVVALVAAARPAVLGIDGRSGAGKTELAAHLAAELAGVRVLHLDDVYRGWAGLQQGLDHVSRSVLAPLSRGQQGRYRRWDWSAGRLADWVLVPPPRAGEMLVVEGCGALAEPCGGFMGFGVWCDAPVTVRRRRVLGRDGHAWTNLWNRWAAQEEGLRYSRRAEVCL